VQAIKRPRLDQGLDRSLVQAAAIDAGTKIEQALERTALTTRRHNGLDGPLARALDGDGLGVLQKRVQ
jgi:hypothetical protein